MKDPHSPKDIAHKAELSAILTVIGVILLFSGAIAITLIAPNYVDPTWTSPTTPYQVQMYEVEDPHVFLSSASTGGHELQYVQQLKDGFTLLAFKESGNIKIIAPDNLQEYITHENEKLKLTTKLLLLRDPSGDQVARALDLKEKLKNDFEKHHPDWKEKGLTRLDYQVMELYAPEKSEIFSTAPGGSTLQNWVDSNFIILDAEIKQPYQKNYGVVYVMNPIEFKITPTRLGDKESWRYNPKGEPVKDVKELTEKYKFYSRKDLISLGEHIYAIEGCWYCHTDQTRTLIQDVVLNGSESYPAPPSSANEYIYQKITFPGTRRIGPDLSRVGIKRPSRDWHKAHFWSPKTASKGSIMPAFQHFFDEDPRGTAKGQTGIPNYRFEAIFQYLMTKGTRITPPTEAWWLGKDPIKTKEIIDGMRTLP